MNSQKGVVHLLLPLVLLLILGGVLYFLINSGAIKNPFGNILQNIPLIGKKDPTVSVKTEYNNPFKKETQYVNPFETYKNPFAVAK